MRFPNSPILMVSSFVLASFTAFATSGSAHAMGRKVRFGDSRVYQGAAPMDFLEESLRIDLDVAGQIAIGNAEIRFRTTEAGQPYLILYADILSAELDGQRVSTHDFNPGSSTTFTALDQELEAGTEHTLKLAYRIRPQNVSFRPGGAGLLTANGDLQTGHFLERYAPASYEDDQYKLHLDLAAPGATSEERVFTNGALTQVDRNAFHIEFPEFYSSTLFYFHLTDLDLNVVHSTYAGLEREIPITVYAASLSAAKDASRKVQFYFRELESDYGPYLHDSFTAYITGKGGMEYAGAAITSVGALDHELLHSWFGRGAIPSDGRSGWIDEGIAGWRDNGYYTSAWPADRDFTNLANFSPFERFTPKNCYRDGSSFMAELDGYLERRGGIRPVLKKFFAEYKTRAISTPLFQLFLETELNLDLHTAFRNYVYGGLERARGKAAPVSDGSLLLDHGSRHPAQLTEAEIESLR